MIVGSVVLAAACHQPEKAPGTPDNGTTDSGGTTDPAPECATLDGPARSPMRRLTPTELDRTLTDLLGTTGSPAARILPPEQVGGFSNNVDVRTVGADTTDAYSRLALEVATDVTAVPESVLTCPDLFEDIDQQVEAEDGTDEGGYYYEDHVALWSPGWVEAEFDLSDDGTYTVGATVRGTVCDGEMAQWNLWIDGDAVAEGDSTEDWARVGIDRHLSAGTHTVRISFANDCYLPEVGEDRNLYVDAFHLSGTSIATGSPAAFSACVTDWLEDLLPRAWRHPIEDATHITRLVDLFDAASAEWGEQAALRIVLEVVLQSPRFLYRVEDTVLDAAPGQVVSLDDHEMASRLSYFLWGTMPDDTLFAAADAGTLSTPEGLQAEAERMLADPRATEVVDLFFTEWLELDHLDDVEKDLTVYPAWTDDRPASFREETVRFVRAVWEDEGASFETLLTADWTIADPELAAYYGFDTDGTGWHRVSRDPTAHAGLLTQGAFLASRARSYGSSPIHRGMFIRGSMLCHIIPGPDPSLEIVVPDPDPDATTREILEQHREDPACASCHDLIDPPGLAFEHFDGIGLWRDYENGLPVDASTDLTGTDVNGFIDGAADLGQALARSTMVRECFARQWFRFAHGRREAEGDECEIEDAAHTFAADHLDMQALVLATVGSPAFGTAVGSD